MGLTVNFLFAQKMKPSQNGSPTHIFSLARSTANKSFYIYLPEIQLRLIVKF